MTTATKPKRGRGAIPLTPEVARQRARTSILTLLRTSPVPRTWGEISILVNRRGTSYELASTRKQLLAELIADGLMVETTVPTNHARKSAGQFWSVAYQLAPQPPSA